MTKFQKFISGILLVIIGLNLIGLWTVQILQFRKQPPGVTKIVEQTKSFSSNESPNGEIENTNNPQESNPPSNKLEKSNGDSTLQQLADNLEKLTARILKLENAPPSETNTTIINKTTASKFQKQTLYLGTAETTNRTWTDTSVEIKLNSFYYPAGVTATFEGAISIVGGEGFARLKNKTSGLVLHETEISHNTSSATWKTSNKFALRYNENTYQVQLRSSSGEKVKLEGARIIIDK